MTGSSYPPGQPAQPPQTPGDQPWQQPAAPPPYQPAPPPYQPAPSPYPPAAQSPYQPAQQPPSQQPPSQQPPYRRGPSPEHQAGGAPGYQPADQPAYQPVAAQYPVAPPPQPEQKQKGTGNRAPLFVLAGVILAGVVALVLGLTNVISWGSSGSGSSVSTAPISLPSTLGKYKTFADAATARGGKSAKTSIGINNEASRGTARSLMSANGGATATVQTYASSDLQSIFSVWAVRADYPDPVVPFENAKVLGLAEPQRKTARYGDVVCVLMSSQSYPAGQTPPKNSYFATICQRSGDGLTVQLQGGGSDLFTDIPTVVKLTNTAYDDAG